MESFGNISELFLISILNMLQSSLDKLLNIYKKHCIINRQIKRKKEKIMPTINELLPLIIPLLVIQIGLVIYALLDLKKHNVKFANKTVWILIIIFVNIFGPILYFVVGRDAYGDGSNDE
jgi:hypothetical protein